MAEEVYLTAEGKKELEERLKHLKTVSRADVTEKIKVARDFGDLSENAEYDAAKAEQSQIEGEIIEIEAKLKNAIIIEDGARHNEVKLGSTIVVVDAGGNKKVYQIVGTTESDPYAEPARISNESPIGSAAMGKKQGDAFNVSLPNGKKVVYTLSEIK